MISVEYYRGKLPLSTWVVDDWEVDHECDNAVVYVVLGSNRICGFDFYAYSDGWLFVWTDPDQPWATDIVGHVYDCKRNTRSNLSDVPLLRCKIREGVMLPDHHAKALGLV